MRHLCGWGSYHSGRSVELLWEPRDLWVGVFWDVRHILSIRVLHIYVCLLPCVVVHVVFPSEVKS